MLSMFSLLAQGSNTSIFGKVEPPPGVKDYNANVSGGNGIGILLFVSNLIRIFTVVAGLYVLINIFYAGFMYISSSGDSKAHTQAVGIFINSLIGLIIIVGAYALAGIIGLIFFGDATYIINPQICGPGGC